MITAYSFDIFDTLITRTVMRPSHVFFLVGRILHREGAGFTPHDYRRARQRAERLARQRALPGDDCTFEDIFAAFPELDRWGIPVQAAMDAELDAERTVTRPIATNIADVKRLQASGAMVVFLSDMYLPRWFVLELLASQSISLTPDAIFLSGELGLSKRTGRLFSFVLKHLGIKPDALHHVGDNSWSDVVIPRRLGISATQAMAIVPTRYEQLPRPRRFAGISRSVLGGIARASRLEVATADTDPAWSAFGCNVAAPLLCGYVRWVLDHARAQGIRRLYFVSRDGQPLYRIALAMAKPGDPECRYLYGSRRAWLLPSVLQVDINSLSWAWAKGTYLNALDILRRLELDTPDMHYELKRHGFSKERLSNYLGNNSLEQLKNLVLKKDFSERILENAFALRSLLVRYLEQEGLLSDVKWALVEVGWILRPQYALQRILRHVGATQPARGYYLGVAANHMPLACCGDVWAYISHPHALIDSQYRCQWFFKKAMIVLLENVFLAADHPTVVGYRAEGGQVAPVFDATSLTKDHQVYVSTLHKSLCVYAVNYSIADLFFYQGISSPKKELLMVKQFAFSPKRQEVMVFAGLQVTMDQRHSRDLTYTLARPLTFSDLIRIIIQDLGLFRARKPMTFFWLHGSLALSSRPTRMLACSLQMLRQLASVPGQARDVLCKSASAIRRTLLRSSDA